MKAKQHVADLAIAALLTVAGVGVMYWSGKHPDKALLWLASIGAEKSPEVAHGVTKTTTRAAPLK